MKMMISLGWNNFNWGEDCWTPSGVTVFKFGQPHVMVLTPQTRVLTRFLYSVTFKLFGGEKPMDVSLAFASDDKS